MPVRSNALSEITRFWLEIRHECLLRESIPVPVPYGQSDIDFLAVRADGMKLLLPDGTRVGPRIIVETKDEHDWDPTGEKFGKGLRSDFLLLGAAMYIPKEVSTKGVRFKMLMQQHYEKATHIFGSDDFDRVFVVHAIDPLVRAGFGTHNLSSLRIHWLTVNELLGDLLMWYRNHPRQSGLRNTLIGDVFHLLVGFCRLETPSLGG